MGIVSTFTFTSDTETVTRTKLNNLVANLLTEFNGSVDNANVKAAAAISATKLNLSTIVQNVAFSGTVDLSAATLSAQVTFADLVATTADINGGTIDGVTIGATVAPTVTDLGSVATCDINGGTIDGVTIGASVAPTVTDLGSVATADMNGGTIDGMTVTVTEAQFNIGTSNQGDVYYDNGTTDQTRLPPGTSGQFLKTQGAAANPVWDTVDTKELGAWASATVGSSTQVATDGFLVGFARIEEADGTFTIKTDSVDPPTIDRASVNNDAAGNSDWSFCVPVIKDDFYLISSNATSETFFFIPLS